KKPDYRDYDGFKVLDPDSFGRDSAVAIYWEEKDMAPRTSRELAFTYGLGSLESTTGKIGLTVKGDFAPKGELSLMALVKDPAKNEELPLVLPKDWKLVDGAEKQIVPPVEAGRPSPVTWRVRSAGEGTFELQVKSSTGSTQSKRIRIKQSSLF